MLTDDVKLISVDDHVIEPPEVWEKRLPSKYVEAGPRVVEGGPGQLLWQWEGRRYPMIFQGNEHTRRFREGEAGTGEDLYARHYRDMIEGAFEVHARVECMDRDGVHAAVLFPTFPRYAGSQFLEGDDMELALACVQAWNDWMIEDWCGAAPTRFVPMAIVPLWDAQLAAAEVARVASMGYKAISFPENPAPLGLPSFWTDHWDPFFAAVQDADLPICMHIGTSGSLVSPSADAPNAVGIALCGVNAMVTLGDLVFSPVLAKFPRLKFVLSEGGSGWVPYLIERMDYSWERSRYEFEKTLRPSELFARNFWSCFISDQAALRERHEIGIDRLLWESDFPHNDSNFPNSRKLFAEAVTAVDVPAEEVRKIGETNARSLFDFWV